MAQHSGDAPERRIRGRPDARSGGRRPPPQPHAARVARYDARGDEPLTIPKPLTLGEPFQFDRGLAKRLRMRQVNASEAFTVRDVSGAYIRASVQEYNARGGRAVPYERMGRSPESIVDLTLAGAVLARQRMHLVVQKATELGVRRIAPLLTDHSVRAEDLAREQAHAWAGHVVRAAKQCRRSSLPHLLAPADLDTFLGSPLTASADRRLFLDDRGDPAAAPAPAPTETPPARIILLVGPEGGFSDAERRRLADTGARPWVLGGRVLRAETAAVVGLVAAHMAWGDFRHVAE